MKNITSGSDPVQFPNPFLSVGFDVGADFSFMSIAAPGAVLVGKPLKVVHSDPESRQRAIERIEKAQESYGLPSRCYLESTGIYHYPLMCFLRTNGLQVNIINPIITKNSTNMNVRKVHSDSADSQKIALLGLNTTLKISSIPDDITAALRDLVRDYYYFQDKQTAIRQKLTAQLKVSFPDYVSIFSDIAGRTSAALLEKWPDPRSVLAADKDEIISLIAKKARRGTGFAEEKYQKLIAAAEDALAFSRQLASDPVRIRLYLKEIQEHEHHLNEILQGIRALTDAPDSGSLSEQVELLTTVPGVGFLSAVSFLAEIGDPSNYTSPRQLCAFVGLDPAVRQSGKFQANSTHISKRGSRIARRVLHSIAMQNVRVIGGRPLNPTIHAYYERKCKTKPKMVAMTAVSRKMCCLLFAVLRDGKPFEPISPEDQIIRWELGRAGKKSVA